MDNRALVLQEGRSGMAQSPLKMRWQRGLWFLVGVMLLTNAEVMAQPIAPSSESATVNQERSPKLRLATEGQLNSNNLKLETGEYYQIHEFAGQAGEQLTIAVDSQEFDPHLILMQGLSTRNGQLGGQHLAEAAGYRQFGATLFVTLPASGRYAVILTSSLPKTEGRYQIQVRSQQPHESNLARAQMLSQQAKVFSQQGNITEAIATAEQGFSLREQSLPPNHPLIADSLSDIAELYQRQKRQQEAELFYQRSLRIREASLGQNHPAVATLLNGLAELASLQGRYDQAETLFQRYLKILQTRLGDDHPDVARGLSTQALRDAAQGRFRKSEALFRRSLTLLEAQLGTHHPELATHLSHLALVYRWQGRFTEAETQLQRGLKILEAQPDRESFGVAETLFGLATLYHTQGRYDKANQAYQRGIGLYEARLGADHPSLAFHLANLADLYWAQGKIPSAIATLTRSLELEEPQVTRNLAFGNETQRQAYSTVLKRTTTSAIALHLQAAPRDRQAAQLAFTTLLRRKGRILDASTNSIQALRQTLTPPEQVRFDRLAERHNQIASLYYEAREMPPEIYRGLLQTLTAEANALEIELSRRSAEVNQQLQPITLKAVQAEIPANAALVEIVRYQPLPTKTNRLLPKPRYAAYLLTRNGVLDWVDLGDATIIHQQVKQFRLGLQTRERSPKAIARQLDTLLMQPIRARLNQRITHLLISPDGELHLIPFAALVDERDRYLVESYEISYLTSGRDLLRMSTNLPSVAPSQLPVLLANPNYDTGAPSRQPELQPANQLQAVSSRSTQLINLRAADAPNLSFSPLPETASEVEAIAAKLPGAKIFQETQATELALKQVQSPRILHIATHGFFLKDKSASSPNSTRQGESDRTRLTGNQVDNAAIDEPKTNPLLRSGLALAGANRLNGGTPNSDGILTALEATQLNLRGTQLVVLSACDGGLGDVATGEGVYGLRRALTLAGAQSQVMSLWAVSDDGTRDWMVIYYDELLSGANRSQALLNTQRAMLKRPQYRHPYYWAAFVLVGDWRSLR